MFCWPDWLQAWGSSFLIGICFSSALPWGFPFHSWSFLVVSWVYQLTPYQWEWTSSDVAKQSLQPKPCRLLTLKALFPLPVHRDFGKFAFKCLNKNGLDLWSSRSGESAGSQGASGRFDPKVLPLWYLITWAKAPSLSWFMMWTSRFGCFSAELFIICLIFISIFPTWSVHFWGLMENHSIISVEASVFTCVYFPQN